MNISLPPLLPGDTVGCLSLAAPVRQEQVQAGLNYLKSLGYRYRLANHAFSDAGLVSAPPEIRSQEWQEFLHDPSTKAIWCLRGGYGSIQLLPLLNKDLLGSHPKWLIGFSDLTALQWGIWSELTLPSLSGLTLTTQMYPGNPFVTVGLDILSQKRRTLSSDDPGLETLKTIRSGAAAGRLLGGTLSMICTLPGSRYWPEDDPLILFLEDTNEPLYRIDRMIWQLKLAGLWKRVSGLILGKFLLEDKLLDVAPLLLPHLKKDVPIVADFPYGHFADCCPLPIGLPAQLETGPFSLRWEFG